MSWRSNDYLPRWFSVILANNATDTMSPSVGMAFVLSNRQCSLRCISQKNKSGQSFRRWSVTLHDRLPSNIFNIQFLFTLGYNVTKHYTRYLNISRYLNRSSGDPWRCVLVSHYATASIPSFPPRVLGPILDCLWKPSFLRQPLLKLLLPFSDTEHIEFSKNLSVYERITT